MIKTLEILSLVTGVGYAILAARRNRLCWVSGAVSSAAYAVVCAVSQLPMQTGLQVFYVGVSVYGWWSWTRSSDAGELRVGVWPPAWHAAAAVALIAASYLSARLLTDEHDAWPLLDSLTTWFSLLATWLATRARIENWLYWIAIDGVLVYLFYIQDHVYLALLNAVLIGIAVAGFVSWRRRYRAVAALA